MKPFPMVGFSLWLGVGCLSQVAFSTSFPLRKQSAVSLSERQKLPKLPGSRAWDTETEPEPEGSNNQKPRPSHPKKPSQIGRNPVGEVSLPPPNSRPVVPSNVPRPKLDPQSNLPGPASGTQPLTRATNPPLPPVPENPVLRRNQTWILLTIGLIGILVLAALGYLASQFLQNVRKQSKTNF